MIDLLRTFLYPLGLIANLLFGVRFFLQWIQSEKRGESMVTPLFWVISLIANGIMCLHAFIQLQYPVCLIQSLNAVIAWRNLNLMAKRPLSIKKTVAVMALTALAVSLLFIREKVWMRPPTMPWNGIHASRPPLTWHLIGIAGMFLFASRFWIQWWQAEKRGKSYLGIPFWWTSLAGALLSLLYFIRLNDPVNILGYGIGLLPYIRNLMLLKRPQFEAGKGLFVFAGEPSGDLLGGKLIEALKRDDRALSISGVGGPLMRAAGMEITHPMEDFQVMGFSDVLKALPRLYLDFRKIRNHILSNPPAAVVLIDYPDFNMLLAKALRKKGYRGKLIHYVCPSVWAWRRGRVKSLAKTLDGLLSILPFEKECFTQTSLSVTYVGHPLVAAIDSYTYDPSYPLPSDKPILAIFPGSRRHEISLNLPIQWEAAKHFPDYTPVISVARPELIGEIRKHVGQEAHFVPQEKRYELMRAASLALATSGTIILEIGLHAVPTVVTYQLGMLNYLLGRYFFRIRLPFYTLVNIICEREVYPEFIHNQLSADEIAKTLRSLDVEKCREACWELRSRLLEQNASFAAAKTIENLIK
ncbi:MAG: lipid-A-disaccharide synthase [Chlamydiales bacterium]|nr:lipid-A-disaccharide synthase [Chlamydiales bacterium]